MSFKPGVGGSSIVLIRIGTYLSIHWEFGIFSYADKSVLLT
jgi:hypothetical protein